MIARQRANLRRTFAHSEEPTVDVQTTRRLSKTEQELAQVTGEFTAGLEQRFGPIPCLHEAQEAMQSAVAALDEQKIKPAAGFEETALAGLIKARQNLRQILKNGSSSSASECRRYDAQQKQKLRQPPKKKDDKERLAQLQNEIEQLAKEEKKFSEDIASTSGGGAELDSSSKEAENNSKSSQSKSSSNSSSSSPSGSKSSPSKAGLAQRQEQAANKAAELQQLVRQDEALTDLARARMGTAARTVQSSAKAMREGHDGDAGKQAADAAEQLERLARQVAALKAKELANKVANAERMARQLAKQQQATGAELQKQGSKKSNANGKEAAGERGQSEGARTLADLLSRTQADAVETDSQLGQALRRARETDPPGEIVEQMQQAADALETGKRDQARRNVDQAAHMLERLAQQLETARRDLVQPQLERLMAAEKQAAEAQKALNSVTSEPQKGEAEKKVHELRDTMESLSPKDDSLNEATDALANAVRSVGGWTSPERTPNPAQGRFKPPVVYTTSLQLVMQRLQAKIQEMILKEVLLDKDEAVPPQYKKLVEEYYRVLSEDLR